MSEYRHGAYADPEASRDYVSPPGIGTIPVYVGRAPVHQLADYAGRKDVPLLINSYNDAIQQIGYSDDWENYELSEAVYAHFKNNVQSVGPIVVINAMDPETGKGAQTKSVEVQFSKRRATIRTSTAILSTLALADKTADVDYTAVYSADGMSVQLTDLKGGLSSVTVTYSEVDPASVTEEDVVDALVLGLKRVYYDLGEVPTILCAPGWSEKKVVYEALVASAEKVNGHWYAYVNADLDCRTAKTISAAIDAKAAYETEAGTVSLLWPRGKKGTRVFHASVLNTVTMQRVDYGNGNVPYETPSNKRVDIDSMCLADGTPIQYDQEDANLLNAAGIDTMTFWEGTWRMWGSHTAAFSHDKVMNDRRDIFDVNVRLVRYVANLFPRRYGDEVDKPMKRSRKDTMLNDFQAQLDAMISDGALLLGTIAFEEGKNSLDDMVEGNFVFTTEISNPVPGKNLTTSVRWTSEGLLLIFGGDENE